MLGQLEELLFGGAWHEIPEEELHDIHGRDENSLQHFSPLEDGESCEDVVDEICVLVEPGLGFENELYFPEEQHDQDCDFYFECSLDFPLGVTDQVEEDADDVEYR